MNKPMQEWTVDATWGKIAMVSWGNPSKPPMLLVHGYMDSAATFILLLEQLPDTHYYVAFDMPGHGKSDSFPPGMLVSQLNIVEVIRLIVKHMDWKNFIYMSHSMGFVIGMFYNHLFPGKITKMIHIDPAAPISVYFYVHNTVRRWYENLYDIYYSSYDRWNEGSTRRLTLDEAVNLLVRSRSISENQAEVVLSRCLVPAGDGKFKLSWETRMKKIAAAAISEETFYTVMTQHAPPMLIVQASENIVVGPGLTSRGHPDGEPVFCVHGRQDSSSVFGPLVDLMPNMNHYVCLDMPGNGLSDGFPPGPKLMRFHFLMAMELAIAHLGWDHFIFIGHSMGCEQGLFFNAIHPNRITKMVLLDANPTLMRMQVEDPAEYQRAFFDTYYENFHRENFERKTHTRISAMRSLARARDLNDSQCADLLQRNFHTSEAAQWHPIEKWHPNEAITPRVMLILNDKDRITDIIKAFTKEEQRIAKLTGVKPNQADRGKRLTEYIVRNQLGVVDNSPPKSQVNEEAFRQIMENDDIGYLSWDNRLKNLAPTNYGNEYYFEIFKNIPPTLLVHASDGAKNIPRDNNWRERAKQLLDKMASLENFHRVNVEGFHDVHYTHPEKVAPHVIKFLENKVNSKL